MATTKTLPLKYRYVGKIHFDFSYCTDWGDEEASPFDMYDTDVSSSTWDDSFEWSESGASCDDDNHVDMVTSRIPSPTTTKIRFALQDKIYFIHHVSEFSDEYKRTNFYQPDELRSIQMLATHVAEVMSSSDATAGIDYQNTSSNNPLDDADEMDTCSRGLECRTEQGDMQRCLVRQEAYSTVLAEQEQMWQEGRYLCPDKIAASYKAISEKCQDLAFLQGLQDAKEISEEEEEDADVYPANNLNRIFAEQHITAVACCSKSSSTTDDNEERRLHDKKEWNNSMAASPDKNRRSQSHI